MCFRELAFLGAAAEVPAVERAGAGAAAAGAAAAPRPARHAALGRFWTLPNHVNFRLGPGCGDVWPGVIYKLLQWIKKLLKWTNNKFTFVTKGCLRMSFCGEFGEELGWEL